jgi:hypothetical protein
MPEKVYVFASPVTFILSVKLTLIGIGFDPDCALHKLLFKLTSTNRINANNKNNSKRLGNIFSAYLIARAYDGINNLFNLAYELLAWKVHRALISAKLEPYLGFLHSEQFGKPSLVCDFQELYRYLIDDFVIQYCQNLAKRNFTFKIEKMSGQKKGKREYLDDIETRDFTSRLYEYFETTLEIPRIKVGDRQTIETLINEEALLFAKYLRKERREWIPRAGVPKAIELASI